MLNQLLLIRVLFPLGFGDQDDSKSVAWATAMGLYSLPKSKRSCGVGQHTDFRRKNPHLTHLCSTVECSPRVSDIRESQSLYAAPRHILRDVSNSLTIGYDLRLTPQTENIMACTMSSDNLVDT